MRHGADQPVVGGVAAVPDHATRTRTVAPVAMQITIDRTRCMGSGNCQFWAPNVFTLDAEGTAVVVDPAGDPEEKVRLAAEGCPTGAIKVTDA